MYSPAVAEEQYVFNRLEEQAEFERLRLQERAVDWVSMGALMNLGMNEGARCLEAGVGAGLIAFDPAFDVTIGALDSRASMLWRKFLEGIVAGTAPAADFALGHAAGGPTRRRRLR